MRDPDIERVLLGAEEIRERVKALAGEIHAVYGAGEITAVGVLTGAFVFLADLLREIPNPTRVVFARASSYRAASRPGALTLELVGRPELVGKDLLVVEDILDTGRSLAGIVEHLAGAGARSVRTAVLLDKTPRREVEIRADFTGFSVPDEFLVGYGLDYAGRFRHLPYVGVLSRSVYAGGDR
jgi:hypoxanthine phosphoribosyltransferase